MADIRKVLCAVLTIVLYLCFGLGIPIASIAVAAQYDDQCPVQPYVTTYLYVAGAFSLVRAIIGVSTQLNNLLGGDCCEGTGYVAALVIDIPISIFLFCWFIAGSVWVYRLRYKYSHDPDSDSYCNPTLYTFAFAILTTQWVLYAIIMILRPLGDCCDKKQ